MDLEVSISLADSSPETEYCQSLENRMDMVSSQDPKFSLSPFTDSDSDSNAHSDSSGESPRNVENAGNDINFNVVRSLRYSEHTPEKENGSLGKNEEANHSYFKENVTDTDSNLADKSEDLDVKRIAVGDGRSVLIKTPTHSPNYKGNISRQSSFKAPIIANIRIETPVKKCEGSDEKDSQPSEVEYIISVSSQSNVELHMTSSPSIQMMTKANEAECINHSENESSTANENVRNDLNSPNREIHVGNQIVKLRAKKLSDKNVSNTMAHQSQTEEMKRHSTEISQLRRILEQKISGQNSYNRNSYHGTPRQTECPSSPYGSSRSYYNSPARDKRRSYDNHRFNRLSKSHTSSPLHWQNNSRNAAHITDPKKHDFLLDTHQKSDDQHISNMYNDYKNVFGNMTQSISSPQPFQSNYHSDRNNRCYNPYINPRCSTPFYDCDDNVTSQYNTPCSSPGPSSFRSMKKKSEPEQTVNTSEPVVEEDGRVNYYPNCDAKIWLRSCEQEIVDPLSGEHIGQVPLWLSGTLIRNGPGRLQVGEHKYNHLFDGSALLHRFHFNEGKVTYQNKFLKSRSYMRDTKAQRIVVNYFGTRAHPDPCRTIIQNIASKFDFEEHFTDNAQISLYPYGDGLYALTETPFIFRVDPENLDTHEKVDLTKCIAILTHTAHPHVDTDGTVYNIGQGVGPIGPRYHICKFPKTKTDKKGKVKNPFEQAQIVGSVNARWRLNPCYMHSFAMTENYFIIIEQPLVVSVPKILRVVLKQEALIDALQWWEKETKIHVVRRDTGVAISTEYITETFFFLHTINAYEDKGHIILDIATYKNAEMLHCMYVEALKNASYDPTYAQMFRGRPKRWAIPLKPNKDASVGTNLVTLPDTKCQGRWMKKNVMYLTPELLSDIGCEVPRIYYEKYNGRPYRYFYAICSDVDHPNPGTLVKVDVVNKTHVEWSEDNVYPSEPIFVPHPNNKNEDEGVVLSALLRARGLTNQVCLLVLDAVTFKEKARVEFVAPGPIPKCLHGWFVPEGTLKVHKQSSDEDKEETPDSEEVR